MNSTKILLSITFSLGIIFSSCGQQNSFVLKYPEIQKKEKVNIFFGRQVIDDFPILNDLSHPRIQEWFAAQDSLAESYFSLNPLMQEHLDIFTELQEIQNERKSMIRLNEKGNYFYLKYDSSNNENLYYKENLLSPEVLLLEPAAITEMKGITYLNPSFDGKKIAIGYKSDDEDFASHIIILDVKSKKLLADKITNVNPAFGGIEWLPDSSGFIYLYFPVVNSALPGYKKDSYSVLHFLGHNPQKREMIFGNSKSISIPSDHYPKVKIGSSIDQYILAYSANSSDYYDAYITSLDDVLKGKPSWQPFFDEDHKVYFTEGRFRERDFIFRQGSDNGNKISKVQVSTPDFENPIVLAQGSKENPITEMAITGNNIYFSRSKYGVEISVYAIERDEEIIKLETPFQAGYISFFGASVATKMIGAELDGWTADYTRFLVHENGGFKKEGLNKDVEYPGFEKLVSEQIMVTSHDGVEVPFSIVYNRDYKFNGEREVFMYVYGAYGESLSPFFYPIFLNWAMQGGILAFPHVRGGGELGKEWHIQGMKNLKYNSWKDLIACTEELISLGITRKGLISLYTVSAGGIAAGMAINERPDLYASFIAEVPRLHPLGLEAASMTSSTSYLEYGSVKDSLALDGLIKMDPYLNLMSTKQYPPTLIMPSYKDDRIPLWDSGKYIAKLQKSQIGDNPIIMDIDYTSGHGTFNGYEETVKLYSKIFTFARSNMK